jgi:ubiquinone/menaquinone biosynthesis C-methylase UbiE
MPEHHVEAARAFYDASAERYVQFVGTEVSLATEGPLDQSLLVAFIELVKTSGATRVVDVGCGPGRVAAFMAARGLDVVGVDVSPEMLSCARSAHPDLHFVEGRLDELPFEGGTLAGAVCWYSIIYTPPERLGAAFVELARILDAAGAVLVAFQAGDGETVRQGKTLGIKHAVTAYRHRVDQVTRSLRDAGFEVYATATRERQLDHESSPQAFVIAHVQKSHVGERHREPGSGSDIES